MVIGCGFVWRDGDYHLRSDILTARGTVMSGFFKDTTDILEEFYDLEEWLINRTRQAHREFSDAKRRRMN